MSVDRAGNNQVALMEPTLFTRGGMEDTRGASMVQKHAEKLQRAKEEAALDKLRAQWPEMSEAVLVLALEDADWETDHATLLLHRFQSALGPQLDVLAQKLKSARAETSAQQRAGRGAEASTHSADGKKKAKKRGREEKAEAKPAMGASTEAFGKYGVVRETDMDSKRSEFIMWATEVQKVDVESLPKWEEKDMFRTYMEDFNTGTLPHKKYYDLDAYERRRAVKAAKKGSSAGGEQLAFDDEAALKAERKAAAAEAAADRLRDAYNELKYTAAGKVADMREQEMTRMQMNLAYRTADFGTARKLQSRLAPDDPFADPNAVKRLEK
ncbi:hypothetical protein WJX81_003270 [Elliptochloris bilobata]|uniref:Uncharacterized protein n=1 Tax=Elliptochloris bilobata TaxID=381761 RepID=A0AAW1RQU3_9CHLO